MRTAPVRTARLRTGFTALVTGLVTALGTGLVTGCSDAPEPPRVNGPDAGGLDAGDSGAGGPDAADQYDADGDREAGSGGAGIAEAGAEPARDADVEAGALAAVDASAGTGRDDAGRVCPMSERLDGAADAAACGTSGAVDASAGDSSTGDTGDSAAEDGGEEGSGAGDAGDAPPNLGPQRIAGTILVRESLGYDVDLDPAGSALDNDVLDVREAALDRAQPIDSPAWVIGYLGPMLGKLGSASSGEAGDADAVGAVDAGALDAAGDAGFGADAGPTDPAPSGPLGPLDFAGDNVDYYRVNLLRGETATLYVFDPPSGVVGSATGLEGAHGPRADLDLYLLDRNRFEIGEGGAWVEDSLGTGDVEQVVAPTDGDYWLAVTRHVADPADRERAASYALTVSAPVGTIARQAIAQGRLSTSTPALPGEALVRVPFGPASPELAQRVSFTRPANALGYRVARLDAGLPGRGTLERRGVEQVSAEARAGLFEIKRLRRDPGVLAAEPMLRFSPQGLAPAGVSGATELELPDDPELPMQWHVWPVDTFEGWAQSAAANERALGAGVTVAVIDTGVAMAHPDFLRSDGTSQLTADGYDMIADVTTAADGDGRDVDPDDPGDRGASGGGTFHGSHIAGIIAAATNNGVGIVGTAPDARIMPVRVMGRGGGVLNDVVEGVLYAAGLTNATGRLPTRRADIINLSLAGPGRSAALAEAIQLAIDAEVIVIAAAGNYSRPAEEYTPAGEPGVITVSAVDASLRLARYSNFGLDDTSIEIAAMGGDLTRDFTLDARGDGIWSLLHRDSGEELYGFIEGTSMAAAQVSGIAALMKGAWPEMTHEQFRLLLPECAIDLGEAGPDTAFGPGLINAPMAVIAALEGASHPRLALPALHVSPRSFDFSNAYDALPFEVQNTGAPGLELVSVSSSVPWLSVESDSLGPNRLLLDRRHPALEPGVHEARVLIESNAGVAELVAQVSIEAQQAPVNDVGPLRVALLDARDGRLIALQTATAAFGYRFDFGVLPAGSYRVVASTDPWSQGVIGAEPSFHASLPFASSSFDERALCVGPPPAGVECTDAPLAELAAFATLHAPSLWVTGPAPAPLELPR